MGYYITIAFYSEPNFKGNMTMYWLHGIKGNKISYGGTAFKKIYTSLHFAKKAYERVKAAYPTAIVSLNEFSNLKPIAVSHII